MRGSLLHTKAKCFFSFFFMGGGGGGGCYPWGSERGVMGVAHLLHRGTFVTYFLI